MANKSENKFSVGDKVVCISSDRCTEKYGLYRGREYSISKIDRHGYVGLQELDQGSTEWLVDRFELVEQKEKEMTFKNMKFDVAAIAKQLNVEHEEASRIIQEALFERGHVWAAGYGKRVQDQSKKFLYLADNEICHGDNYQYFEEDESTLFTIKPTYTIVEAEEQQEVVELNGKKYNKQELEKALSLLKPIE